MDHPARIGHRRARKAPRLRIGEAREQMTPRDLRLHARKRSPEAVMNAEAERQVLAGVVAVDVEAVRLVEDMGIAIGANEHEDHRFSISEDLAPGQFDGGQRGAEGELHRADVAQRLLDEVGDELRIGRDLRELLRVSKQNLSSRADQVDRRLEAGKQKEGRGTDDVAVVQAIAIYLGSSHRTENVAREVGPTLLEQIT